MKIGIRYEWPTASDRLTAAALDIADRALSCVAMILDDFGADEAVEPVRVLRELIQAVKEG